MKKINFLHNRFKYLKGKFNIKKISSIILIIFLLGLFLLSVRDINKPITNGHKGYNLGLISHVANNYNKLGYGLLGQKWNIAWTGENGKEDYRYYVHHPFGVPLLYSFVFLIFGYSIIVAKLFQIIIFMISLVIFYFLIREKFNHMFALTATFILAIVPSFFLYRDFVSYEFFVIPFALLALLMYTKWISTKNNKFMYFLLLTIYAGTVFSDWAFYFISIPIFIHCIIYYKEKKKILFLVLFPLIFILGISQFLAHNYLLTGSISGTNDIAGNLIERLSFRMNLNEAGQRYGINFQTLIQKIWNESVKFLAKTIILVSIVGVLIIVYHKYKKKEIIFDNLMLLCLLSFILPIFVLSNQFWIHPFMFILNIVPFLAYFMTKFLFSFKHKIVKILVVIVFLVFLINFSVKFYKQNMEGVEPLVVFLSENNENLILTFPLHPEANQVKYYLEKRDVLDIRDINNFKSRGKKDFKYIITKGDSDRELYNYLNQRYRKTRVGDYEIFVLY